MLAKGLLTFDFIVHGDNWAMVGQTDWFKPKMDNVCCEVEAIILEEASCIVRVICYVVRFVLNLIL